MHKKPADKLNTGNGKFFPLTFFAVILHVVGNRIFVYANDAMIADGNPVGVFPQIVNNGLCTVEGLLAVRNLVFFIAEVQKFLERIMIVEFLTASMKLKLFLFPEGFKFVQIFATKQR